MHIAVVGCGHGEVDKIYEVVANIEEKRGIKVGLVICCGDFQTVRNMTDLRCMACPIKFQHMHDFHRYYSGEKKVPIPTLFIGGNHEASNYLQELPYGGWVAPNMYFMGYSGLVRFGNVRIAGISGIYKGHDYLKGRFECPPYDQDTMRSVYHYRNLDTFRLKQVKTHVDIVISHDWPLGIHKFGNTGLLIQQKPFFREEIERDDLGSRPLFELLTTLQPSYWFSAHMHVKFGAVVRHRTSDSAKSNSGQHEESSTTGEKMTKFLALDKVLPRRQFLQIIEIPDTDNDNAVLSYDPEWLAILKSTDSLTSTSRNKCFMPGPGYSLSRYDFSPTQEELEEIKTIFGENMSVPENFQQTGPVHVPGEQPGRAFHLENYQTKDFCEKLGITDPISKLRLDSGQYIGANRESLDQSSSLNTTYEDSFSQVSINPDEISLDDDDDEGGGDFRPDISPLLPSSSSLPAPRKKLVLPPPKDDGEKIPDHFSFSDMNFSSVADSEDKEESKNFDHLFQIDTVGEPDVKKRRNAAFYGSDD